MPTYQLKDVYISGSQVAIVAAIGFSVAAAVTFVGSGHPRYWQSFGTGGRVSVTNFGGVLDSDAWRRTEDWRQADLLYVMRLDHADNLPFSIDALDSHQAINVLSGVDRLTRKAALTWELRRAGLQHWQPDTRLLDDPDDVRQLLDELSTANDQLPLPQMPWIVKESHESRGRGMEIFPVDGAANRARFIAAVIGSNRAVLPAESGLGRVAQRYIAEPMLVNGRKVEMRSYFAVVVSGDGQVHTYHYGGGPGVVRINTDQWLAGDWDNPLRHVANTYQQRRATTAAGRTYEESNLKLSLEDLPGRVDRPLPAGWLVETGALLRTMGCRVLETQAVRWRAAVGRGGSGPRRWQLLGMDTLFDATGRPWLTEMQVGPGLGQDNPVKRAAVPPIVRGMAALATGSGPTMGWVEC